MSSNARQLFLVNIQYTLFATSVVGHIDIAKLNVGESRQSGRQLNTPFESVGWGDSRLAPCSVIDCKALHKPVSSFIEQFLRKRRRIAGVKLLRFLCDPLWHL